MVGVLFHLEDHELFPTPAHLRMIVDLWLETAEAFEVDHVLVVDQTALGAAAQYHPGTSGITYTRFVSLEEAEATYADVSWIYLEQGGKPLSAFEHPRGDVVYAFGPDSTGFVLQPGKTYVEIDTPRPIGLFSLQAAAVVLHQRFTGEFEA